MTSILIVDDRPINREVLSGLLDEQGYVVYEAENGIQAIEAIRKNMPDLIITDIVMPEMDGISLVKELQGDPIFSKIPIIFYSATYKTVEAYRLANIANIKYVLTKPCSPKIILNTIKAALLSNSTDIYKNHEQLVDLEQKHYNEELKTKKYKLENTNFRLTSIIEIGLDMSSEHDVEKLSYIACKGGRQFLDACYGGMILQDFNNPMVSKIFMINPDNKMTSKLFNSSDITGIPLNSEILGAKPICIHSPIIDLEKIGLDDITLPISSFLSIPLQTARGFYGHIYFINKFKTKLFTVSGQRFMMTLADKFSINYENLLLYQKFQQHSKNLEDEILQREKTESFLQEVTERLHLTLEAAHVGTWSWAIQTGDLQWDNYSSLLFGIPPKDFPGTYEGFINLLCKEDRVRVAKELLEMTTQNKKRSIEFKVIWPDGSMHHLMLRGKVHYDEAGVPSRMLGVYWDITDHIQAEEKLHAYREQMADVIRSNLLGEMASSLAHEINQPLAAIAAYIRGCIKHMENKRQITPEIMEILHETALQTERAGEVVHRIKSFVRKGELFYEIIDINLLITEAIHLIRHDLKRNLIQVTFLENKNIVLVEVDKIQLQQVILNLLRNAMEAMQEANTLDPQVVISITLEKSQRIKIHVNDNGPGFSQKIANHLFDLKFTTKSQGMGLGLAICRSIIEAHAGQLTASLLPNGGSSFQFDLPIKSSQKNNVTPINQKSKRQ